MRWCPDGDFCRLFCVLYLQRATYSTFQTCTSSNRPHVASADMRHMVIIITRMWANAQRDGRLAVYRWRPLFNAAKFGWRSLLRRVLYCGHSTQYSHLVLFYCRMRVSTGQYVSNTVQCHRFCFHLYHHHYYSLWSPYVLGQTIIFLPCDFFLSIFFLFFLA